MVTIAEAGRILGPLVAQEVEKETKKIEIRMQVRCDTQRNEAGKVCGYEGRWGRVVLVGWWERRGGCKGTFGRMCTLRYITR